MIQNDNNMYSFCVSLSSLQLSSHEDVVSGQPGCCKHHLAACWSFFPYTEPQWFRRVWLSMGERSCTCSVVTFRRPFWLRWYLDIDQGSTSILDHSRTSIFQETYDMVA